MKQVGLCEIETRPLKSSQGLRNGIEDLLHQSGVAAL